MAKGTTGISEKCVNHLSVRDSLPAVSVLTCSNAGGHPLCLRCLTMEMCRPKLRWTEQHSSQIRTPRLMLVQPGSRTGKEKPSQFDADRKLKSFSAHTGGVDTCHLQTRWLPDCTMLQARVFFGFFFYSGLKMISRIYML